MFMFMFMFTQRSHRFDTRSHQPGILCRILDHIFEKNSSVCWGKSHLQNREKKKWINLLFNHARGMWTCVLYRAMWYSLIFTQVFAFWTVPDIPVPIWAEKFMRFKIDTFNRFMSRKIGLCNFFSKDKCLIYKNRYRMW